MKRSTVSMILGSLLALSGSASAFAGEPAFCKSMCTSQKSECLANANATEKKEGMLPTDGADKNPYARNAQMHVRPNENGALEHSGVQYRRDQRAGTCDAAYQRCTRDCSAGQKEAIDTVVSRRAKEAGKK